MRSVFLLALLTAGCAVELEGIENTDESNDVESTDVARVALNGLTATDYSQLRALAADSLATAPTRVPAMFSTADGRTLFSYLFSCAATAGKTHTVTVNGVAYSFTGAMGIAKEWELAALPASKYKRVSACILARTNYFGTEVAISMRSSYIASKATELTSYTVLEGAFWGDLFSTTPTMRACPSPTKLSGSTVSTLAQRECTVSIDGVTTKCGFGYARDCTKVCVTDSTNKLGYSNCEGNADTIAVYLVKP